MSDGRTWGTIIGGVVGYFTGGIGFAAGAAIGGAVGGLLEPKQHTETNRIDDIKVSISKYGDMIPETWGNNVPTATAVWSTYIIEIGETQSQGKGGGVENTNYRQFIQSMWCLGRTPPPGTTVTLRKAWINGKLNYDSSSGLSAAQALATEENPWVSIALLPGFDDQLPVPMIETYEGVGNVPAFRGRICLFIYGLECPGGRVPQLAFELCIGADVGPLVVKQIDVAPAAASTGAVITAEGVWSYSVAYDAPYFDVTYSFSQTGPMQVMGKVGSIPEGGSMPYPVSGGETPQLIKPYDNGDLYLIDLEAATFTLIYSGGASGQGRIYGRAAYDPTSGLFVVNNWDTGSTGNDPVIFAPPNGISITCEAISGDGHGGVVAFYDGVVHVVTTDGTAVIHSRRTSAGLSDASMPETILAVGSMSPRWSALYVGEGGVYLYAVDSVGGSAKIYKILPATAIDPGEFVLLCDDTGATTATIFSTISKTFYCTDTFASIGPIVNVDPGYNLIRFSVPQPVEADVATFIESQNLRAGLAAEQIDVSTINDSFWGLTLKSPASARANITPVMTYSAIGVVEEDGALRYFRRADKASVVTIPYEDLGFAEDGSEPGDPFPLVHANAQELPRSITVSYNDPNFDYQVSTVKAMRYAVDSVLDETVTLDMAIDGSRAATVAYRLLFEKWLAQNSRSLAVSRAYAYLSAGDVITVLSRNGSYGDFMTSKITDTGARIEIECFPADSELLIQTVPGPQSYLAQSIDPLAPPTRLQLLDIPILRDVDNNAGLYAALDNLGDGWTGAELLSGYDDASLVSRGTVAADAPIGFAETILGNASSGFVDESNIFTVNIGNNDFESVTREVLLANGGEFWAYGAPGRWEIGSSAQGDALGDGRYILSRHLRGQFGTEANAALHQAGDKFVLLRIAGMLRPLMGVGDIGQAQKYRAVSKGRSLNSAASQTYTNTGEGLRPLSPINLRRSNTNDLSVDRRSRLAMNNSTGEIPLGEATEAWAWDFYTSSGFTTLIGTALTATATVTAAQIAAAGASPSGALYVRVSQISQSVGRGHELQGIL